MPYCPSCRGEFRLEIERCEACDTVLVAELGPDFSSPDEMAGLLDGRELTLAALGPLLTLKTLRTELGRAQVACLIGPPPEDQCGKGCTPRLGLYVASDEVPRARTVLDHMNDDDLVATQDESGSDSGTAHDACPACGTRIPSSGGAECGECGLFFGE